jgi:anti-sigma B factor antagonist
VRLAGEFDLRCEEPFRHELGNVVENETARVVLDLHALEFIDSTGLGVLVQIHALARNDGFDFAVVGARGGVHEVLSMSGLAGLLPMMDERGAPLPSSDSPV